MHIRTLDDGRQLLDSGATWEPLMGYSRAVRAGDQVHVSGCLGLEADGSYAASLRRQTERALERIEHALSAFGGRCEDIIRVRLYTTRIEAWREIADVMGPRFAATRPANTLVGIAALVDPAALIEIEADAWLPPARVVRHQGDR